MIGIEAVRGSAFDDTTTGGDRVADLTGFERLTGEAGNDILDGGTGINVLVGGAGNDVLTGAAEGDFFDFNIADYRFDPSAIIVNLTAITQAGVASGQAADGFGGTDTLSNIDVVKGSSFDDQFFIDGTEFGNFTNFVEVRGGDGNDTITVSGSTATVRIGYNNADGGVEVDLAAGTAQATATNGATNRRRRHLLGRERQRRGRAPGARLGVRRRAPGQRPHGRRRALPRLRRRRLHRRLRRHRPGRLPDRADGRHRRSGCGYG